MCSLCGRPDLVHDLGGAVTTYEWSALTSEPSAQPADAATLAGLNGTDGNAMPIPGGAEAEIAFICGVTANASVAPTSFGSWAAAGARNPATYSSTWSWATKWGSTELSTAGSPGGNVTYWFDSDSNWSAAEKAALSAGAALWSAEANITFSLARDAANAGFIFYRGDDGGAYQDFPNQTASVIGSGTEGAHGAEPYISIDATTAGFGPIGVPLSVGQYGNYAYQTLMHELGHMLGLGHAGPYK